MDKDLSSILTGELASGIRHSSQALNVVNTNLVQGLGVINSGLIQQHGGTADDSATMAALRASIHVPKAATE